MYITKPLSHTTPTLKLKKITKFYTHIPIIILNNINTYLKINPNILFKTIIIYQINNTHLKNSSKIFSYNNP